MTVEERLALLEKRLNNIQCKVCFKLNFRVDIAKCTNENNCPYDRLSHYKWAVKQGVIDDKT